MSLNKLLGMHRMKRADYKKEISAKIGWFCRLQNIQPVKSPVIMQYILTFDVKRKRDYDNYLGGTKYFNDALRDASIIPEDNSEIIQGINMTFNQGDKKQTQLIICELE